MSIGIKFLYTFLVGDYDLNNPGSNVISITSEAPGFSKTNLTTTPLREVWRSGPDISVWQEIVIKANSTAERPDIFSILNHNLSPLAVIQVQGSMTTNFVGAPTLTMQWTKKHAVLLQDLGITYNYYRFRILDPSNPCGFLEVGRIIAGKSFTFVNDEDITDEIQLQTEDLAYKTRTEGFFRAFNQRVKVDKLNVRFSKLKTDVNENANYLGLLAMIDVVGETFPFLTIVDPFDQGFILHWGVIDQLPTKSFGINRYVDMSLPIQEVY